MKRIFFNMIFSTAFLSSVLYAQGPVVQKSASTVTAVARPHEIRSEEKREELSKKLMQRKSELRREDHEHDRGHRSANTKEKQPSTKQ